MVLVVEGIEARAVELAVSWRPDKAPGRQQSPPSPHQLRSGTWCAHGGEFNGFPAVYGLLELISPY